MNLFASSNPIEVDSKSGICKIEGIDYPIVGFGTYPLTGDVCTEALRQAAKIGYRIIDTATYYENFDSIAKALKGQDRSHFYIISKVGHDDQSPEDLCRDLDLTLKQLQTDYLDAYLLHWPNSKMSIKKTLAAMEELRQQKKIRHIGLSNVSVNHLKKALEIGIPITWVQVEMHPYFYDSGLLDFCREHSMTVQAWRPLDLGRISEDEMLGEIGKKYGKTACQIALRWIIQHGCIPLPGSKNANHIRENLDVTNFVLSKEDMVKIDQRALSGTRFRLKEEHGLGFTDEFDFSYEECWPR
ncbi:MAG: aldo/keto reductase [Rhabdochlamydiaceae bacterium]|nr:aldo/keto reductase [Rhabdochlamydiaceae bacterium]